MSSIPAQVWAYIILRAKCTEVLGYEVENIFTIFLQFFNREISHFY